jgi:hypothetical protein
MAGLDVTELREPHVIGESTSLFKVFRVLWFPLSINAMALSAIAAGLFYGGTWLAVAVSDLPDALDKTAWTSVSVSRFPADCLRILTDGWPADGGLVLGTQLVLFFLLWATFGVAVCRILALRIARDEYCPMGQAFAYAWRIKLTGILFPLAILAPVAFLLVCNQVAGLVTAIPVAGAFIGLLLIPLVLISSLLVVLLAVAGIASVGLVPPAIAIERKGTYDSLGKAMSYVFARPLPLILHLLVVALFVGFLHRLLVEHALVQRILAWSMTPFFVSESFGNEFRTMVLGHPEALEGWRWLFAWGFQVLFVIYRLLVWGALISFTLGAFTSLFFVLRKDVDGVDYVDLARDPADAPLAVPAPEVAKTELAETPEIRENP